METTISKDSLTPGLTEATEAVTAFLHTHSRNIREIILHCSATPEGRDIRAADIRLWHTRDRGFSDIGYHFVVDIDGTVELGRPLTQTGAHCTRHNRNSIGVCYIGGITQELQSADTRTMQQRQSLQRLMKILRRAFPKATVHGHRDFAPKDCPCFDAKTEY